MPTKTPIELSSTPSIVDNGDATAITITSDEDFLVRQTSADVYDTNTGGTVRQFWGNQFSAENNTNTRVIIGSGSNAGLVGGATVNSGGTRPIVNSYISFGSTNQTAGSEAGMVQFYTSTGGAVGAVRARIDSDGLKFGSDSAAANALDDYEEGTFEPSPSIAGGGGSISFASDGNLLSYTKIGNLVFITGSLQISANSATAGRLNLSNLPFACIDGTDRSGRALIDAKIEGGTGSQDSGYFTVINEGSSTIQIQTYTGIGSSNNSAVTMAVNSLLLISGHYQTT